MTENQPTDDYDSPWKEIFEQYFREFIEFFFPEAHSDIDWGKGYVFLDKELQQIPVHRLADALADLRGEETARYRELNLRRNPKREELM